tara:strand:+ start:969 stop:2120 length:1152 start_codon:yes stop_codon:yes gene_type:complete
MNWRNTLLKAWGDRHEKEDGSTFIEDVGFTPTSYSKDKGKTGDLVNWFKTIQQTFDTMLDSIGFSTETDTEPSGTSSIRRDKSNAAEKISMYGQDIARKNIDAMLEGYVKAITTDAKFNDDMTNMQSIMSSSGYNRTVEAALNMTEELITSIFDASYRGVKMTLDEPPIVGQEGDLVDITGSVPKEIIDSFWETSSQPIETDIKNILLDLDNHLDDIILDNNSKDLDLDNDGEQDVSLKEIKQEIKESVKKVFSNPEMLSDIKQFTGNVSFSFLVKLPLQQKSMEDNKEVSDQVDEEEAEEIRNRPEVQAGELDEEERRNFEDEYKSNDRYIGEHGWKSILSKEFGTGMTTNANFSPAVHNLQYSKSCKSCEEDKETSCGCSE